MMLQHRVMYVDDLAAQESPFGKAAELGFALDSRIGNFHPSIKIGPR